MTGSVYGFGWPSANPFQQAPWGLSPFASQGPQQILQVLHGVPQQLQQLQQLTFQQQQQLQQIQQLLLLIPQQFQQALQQLAYITSHQLQSPTASTPFQTLPFGQQIFPGQPGHVM